MLNQQGLPSESKILVVANQDVNYQKICQFLTDSDYKIQCLSDKYLTENTILNLIENQDISLVFIADDFKNIDVYELCQKINFNRNQIKIPLIFLGELADSKEKIKAFKFGALDYISPPYYEEEILTKVKTFLSLINCQQQLLKINAELAQQKDVDCLTNLANKNHFLEYLEQEWNRCARERVSLGDGDYTMLSLILIGIDPMENNRISSLDQVLIEIGIILKERLKRPTDLLARYEEKILGIVLPNTDSKGLLKVSEVLFELLKSMQESNLIKLSFGGVTRIPSKVLASDFLIEIALDALEKAKQNQNYPIFINC